MKTSASSAKYDIPIALSGFVEYLRLEGFTIGIDHHFRLQELIKKLDSNCSPYELKSILCPIFATSKSQQAQFNNAFDLYFDMFQPATPHVNSRGENEKDSIGKKSGKLRPSNKRRILVVTGLIVLAFILGL